MQPVVQLSVTQRNLSWQAAQAAVAAAVAAAEAQRVPVNIALVDAGGLLAAFLRMPQAPLHSIDIAIDKAYTAASFGLPTGQWRAALAQHSDAVRDGLPRRPRFIAFGGGLPLVHDGQRLGGIGVSGGSEEQDDLIARAALQALGLS